MIKRWNCEKKIPMWHMAAHKMYFRQSLQHQPYTNSTTPNIISQTYFRTKLFSSN